MEPDDLEYDRQREERKWGYIRLVIILLSFLISLTVWYSVGYAFYKVYKITTNEHIHSR